MGKRENKLRRFEEYVRELESEARKVVPRATKEDIVKALLLYRVIRNSYHWGEAEEFELKYINPTYNLFQEEEG